MKKLLSIILIMLFASQCLATGELQSAVGSWNTARAMADEEVRLDLTAVSDFSNVSKANGWFKIPIRPASELVSKVNGLQFIASASSTSTTHTWRILSAAAVNGPIEVVATGTGETGTQPVILFPTLQNATSTATNMFWVDNFVISTQNWWKTIALKNGNASNFVGGIVFDGLGSGWYKVEVTDADGSGSESTDVTYFWKFF